MYLPLVQSHEASMPILFVPKYAPVWGNGSISFISVQSCSSPRVEISGCSAVRLYSTSPQLKTDPKCFFFKKTSALSRPLLVSHLAVKVPKIWSRDP